MTETLVANRWYPEYKGPGRSYKSSYPTPQSVLRTVLGESNYTFKSQTVDCEFIRAACVVPLDQPFGHLLTEPWAMSYRTAQWRMIIVSSPNPDSWIDLAKSSGAQAYQRGHSRTFVYKWEAPAQDENGLVIRPANALAMTRPSPLLGRQRKLYDKDEILELIHQGEMNYTDIGKIYDLSRLTILKIAQDAGIRPRTSTELICHTR